MRRVGTAREVPHRKPARHQPGVRPAGRGRRARGLGGIGLGGAAVGGGGIVGVILVWSSCSPTGSAAVGRIDANAFDGAGELTRTARPATTPTSAPTAW